MSDEIQIKLEALEKRVIKQEQLDNKIKMDIMNSIEQINKFNSMVLRVLNELTEGKLKW